EGHWSHIQFWDPDSGFREGYAFDGFLGQAKDIRLIPQRALNLYYSFFLGQMELEVDDRRGANAFPFSDKHHPGQYENDCYPYYEALDERYLSLSDFSINGSRKEIYDGHPILDTIQTFLRLSLATNPAGKGINNPYHIDTKAVQHQLPSRKAYAPNFSLPLSGEKDSILIESVQSEVLTTAHFVGRIHPFNQYVVNYQYEGPFHQLIDQESGKATDFTEGFPLISPDGKYVIDFYHNWNYDETEGCQLTLSKLNKDFTRQRLISVNYKSWMPIGGPDAAVWISNRELVFQAVPMRYFVETYQQTNNPRDVPVQYIKLRINR
ncbi:MAG: hypothetical protein AAF206_06760, partial [Bacteroidota bacterium]